MRKKIIISGTKFESLHNFSDRIWKNANDINTDNHQSNHVSSQITIVSKFTNIGIHITYINRILEEMAKFYARLINQKNKYHVSFLATFKKYGEDGELINQIELPNTLSMTRNLTQSEIDNIYFQWTLENGIQTIESQESR